MTQNLKKWDKVPRITSSDLTLAIMGELNRCKILICETMVKVDI